MNILELVIGIILGESIFSLVGINYLLGKKYRFKFSRMIIMFYYKHTNVLCILIGLIASFIIISIMG